MTDQNNEGWPAVLRLNDHYMEEIVGWMQADDKVSGGMTYIRADRAAPEGQVQALEHLRNVMGHIDTPIARRHLRINEDQPEWLTEAREFLAALTPQPAAQEPVAQRCAECACQQEAVTVADREEVAFALWREEVGNTTLRRYRTRKGWGDQSEDTRERFLRFADAALRALKGDKNADHT